mmetsp:Transcript_589/g.1194  ORF Transcript_589/g.1194 Transcript_589/m.1194 type:complete len:401 (+) Transcript_589:77-1279(+)|eukprot:CAMPEP_0119094860 /NCGR_PEP_ID=MMETSP1178-20130426/167673_1 /TAXON_ID=33656 /ORGANISM="unid sp, Strain CCMP2000" /LENGTH=400 /DNA_ID=CAMNT_0007078629 /DNA_START=77 /DNA_END=1279 /DNA_ORIENTATION=+
MKQLVLDWLAEVESGSLKSSHGLEAVSMAVQQDPAALATLVQAGGLAHVVARQGEESASVATILVVASEEYAQELVEANALSVIVGLVTTEAHQEDSAWALGNLSAHADIADSMISYGALRACLTVLAEPQTQLSRCFVASTLANLAVDVRGKPAIGEMGGVEALLQVLPMADIDAAAQITRCLANLLLDDACRGRVVAHEGGLSLLLQQVGSPDESVQESAVRAIANVAFDPEQAKVVFAAGAVCQVVGLLESNSVRVQLQALCALRNLTADAPAAFEVVAHGAIAQLVPLLHSASQQVQVQAVWVIGALALHEEANLQLVSAGVLPLLDALKHSTDAEAQQAASQALGNLARVLTPNSRRVIEQDTLQLDRGGRPGGRANRRQSPLARAVWTSPLTAE